MQKIYTIDPIEALKVSIQSEKEMQAFYNKAAALMENQDAASILKGFAEHAADHRDRCIDMYSTISGKKILFLNLDKRHKLTSLQKCGDDPMAAIRIAKRNEKELSEFYLTISRRFIESDLRKFFRDLAADNQQHLVLLEASFAEPVPGQEDKNDVGHMIGHQQTSNG